MSQFYQSSFVGGEISPEAFGRVDLDTYFRSAATLKNVYLNSRGNVLRREGLQYISSTLSNQEARLVSFEFNREQVYLIEFTPGQFRVFRDDVVQTTVATTLTATQIAEFDFVQSADTLFLVHEDFNPIKITRTSDVNWTIEDVTFEFIPQFAFGAITESTPSVQITPSGTTGDITLTAASNVFGQQYVGQLILINNGLVFVNEVVSTTELKGFVRSDLSSTDPSTDWTLESGYEDVWSNTRGWPKSVTFFQSRLYFGGSGSRPQTLWGSKVGNFFNFDIAKGDDGDAIDVTIDDDQVNAIQRLFPGRNLQIFTTGGEFYVPTTPGNPVTPALQLIRSTQHGSKAVRPVSVDGSTLFIEFGGRVIRQFVFNEVEQSYNAGNISILASHLIKNPKEMTIRRSNNTNPSDFVYFINEDGTVTVLNTLREQNLNAFTQFETQGSFESIAVVGREVYFVIKRNINGSVVRYIEKLNQDYFMDASTLQTSATPQNVWSGLEQLEAETVKVRGDEFIFNNQLVTGGTITTEDPASKLEAGLNFAAEIKTLPVDGISGNTQLTGEWKRLVYANMRLINSRNVVVQVERIVDGIPTLQTYKPPFRFFGSNVLDTPITLFNGWKKTYISGTGRDVQVIITQEEPLEFNLLSIDVGMK